MDYTSYGFESSLRTIFKRCVECPPTSPSCPTCSSGEICSQTFSTCTQCAQAVCVPLDQSGSTQSAQPPSPGPNIGAIVGGIVGGLIFIALLTYLIWRFFIKPRRAMHEDDFPEDFDPYGEKSPDHTHYSPTSNARNSTYSVRSVASTVLTRASNVIQIAFIPGITDRSHDSSIPPVPSIPLQQSTTPSSPYEDSRPRDSTAPSSPYDDPHPTTPYSDRSTDHYFMPSDLRQSAWSDFSSTQDSTSVRHQSVASSLARQSMASTIYGAAETAVPAQTALRGRANVVSVKPTTSSTTSPNAIPDVPSIDYFKYKEDGAEASKNATATGAETSSDTDGGVAIKPKPSGKQLAQAIEAATNRASRQPVHGGLGSVAAPPNPNRDPSPFSDAHAVDTP